MAKKKAINIYISDDYAGLESGNITFYYGYERQWCQKCKKKLDSGSDLEECEENDHDIDWCFTVNRKNEEVFRLTETELNEYQCCEPVEYLLAGIGIWLAQKGSKD